MMKKFSTGILITIVVAFVFELLGLWQGMIVAGIIGGLVVNRTSQAFLVGFIGVAMCWLSILIYSAIVHHVLPLMKMTGRLLMIPDNYSYLLLIGTLLLGGILGGLGGLNGLWWRKVFLGRQ